MKCDTYKEDLPSYSICYLIYGDESGLDDSDVKNINEFMEYYRKLAKGLNGHICIEVGEYEDFFTYSPPFGLPCDCLECHINILYS